MIERRVLGRQRHPQLQSRAFDLAFADDTLDLPLRDDVDHLEEFAESDVEAIFVNCDPPKRVRAWWRMIAEAGKRDSVLNTVDPPSTAAINWLGVSWMIVGVWFEFGASCGGSGNSPPGRDGAK
jgi:hypothetical protein